VTESVPAAADAITIPAAVVVVLADLLTEVDQFLHSGSLILDDVTDFMRYRGHRNPEAQLAGQLPEGSGAQAAGSRSRGGAAFPVSIRPGSRSRRCLLLMPCPGAAGQRYCLDRPARWRAKVLFI
jgi:hypothetical protein